MILKYSTQFRQVNIGPEVVVKIKRSERLVYLIFFYKSLIIFRLRHDRDKSRPSTLSYFTVVLPSLSLSVSLFSSFSFSLSFLPSFLSLSLSFPLVSLFLYDERVSKVHNVISPLFSLSVLPFLSLFSSFLPSSLSLFPPPPHPFLFSTKSIKTKRYLLISPLFSHSFFHSFLPSSLSPSVYFSLPPSVCLSLSPPSFPPVFTLAARIANIAGLRAK